MKNEMLALILAGGQGTRLGKLTKNIAKPAVQFGGRYRIIDFALSNCANSGIHNVGVITQYGHLPLTAILGMVPAGAWMESIRVCLFSNLIQLVKEIVGLKELAMPSSKTSTISTASIRNMS